MKLRKGMEHCAACGKVVSQKRKAPHSETGECLIRCTVAAYEARDWAQIGKKFAEYLREAGVPVEEAPHSLDPFAKDVPAEVTQGFYAPRGAIRACEALVNTEIGRTLRTAAIKVLIANPELAAAIDTVRRMQGRAGAKHFVRGIAWEEHTRLEEAKTLAQADEDDHVPDAEETPHLVDLAETKMHAWRVRERHDIGRIRRRAWGAAYEQVKVKL